MTIWWVLRHPIRTHRYAWSAVQTALRPLIREEIDFEEAAYRISALRRKHGLPPDVR